MPYPSSAQVQEAFSKFNSDWDYEYHELERNLEFRFSKDNREALFHWSNEMPEEVWFSLSSESGCDLTDWTEMFEEEREHKALFEYLELITHRYLECNTRIKKKFVFFGGEVLQYLNNGEWCELRSPI